MHNTFAGYSIISTKFVATGGSRECNSNCTNTPAVCTRGMVHLEGGATAAQGTVAVCFRNRWGAVCDTYWTAAEAKVVCRQLGYTGKENGFHITCYVSFSVSSDGQELFRSYYGLGYESITWDRVGGCRGNESTLAACAYTIPLSTCYNNNRAGVSCYSK